MHPKELMASGFPFLKFLSHYSELLSDRYTATLFNIAVTVAKSDGVICEQEDIRLKQIFRKIHATKAGSKENIKTIFTKHGSSTLDSILAELDSLVGLRSVKDEVNSIVNFVKVQNERKIRKLKTTGISHHLVLTGSPGTGKTTVARIISRIYVELGILKRGHLVETDRSGLIGEYMGHTAPKVNKLVGEALDGVLFIDEAYSLMESGRNDYGREAVAALLKKMEDERERLVVIVAGYTDEMRMFIQSNPGLKSRFNRYLEFPDYTPSEMIEIFVLISKNMDFAVSVDARDKLMTMFEAAYKLRDRSFGNGRFVRNVFEKVMERHANRVSKCSVLTKDILVNIEAEDIPLH